MKYIYVDNSNLYIGAREIAAVKQGLAAKPWEVTKEQSSQSACKIDYSALFELLSGGERKSVKCAKLWGSEPPDAPFWNMVEGVGFEAIHWARNFANKEKGVDAAIVRQITKDECTGKIDKSKDEIILVSGDADFAPMSEELVESGFKVTVFAWNHKLATDLQNCGAVIEDLTPHFDELSYSK